MICCSTFKCDPIVCVDCNCTTFFASFSPSSFQCLCYRFRLIPCSSSFLPYRFSAAACLLSIITLQPPTLWHCAFFVVCCALLLLWLFGLRFVVSLFLHFSISLHYFHHLRQHLCGCMKSLVEFLLLFSCCLRRKWKSAAAFLFISEPENSVLSTVFSFWVLLT